MARPKHKYNKFIELMLSGSEADMRYLRRRLHVNQATVNTYIRKAKKQGYVFNRECRDHRVYWIMLGEQE